MKGYRTYLLALGVIVVTGIHALGWITPELYQTILGFLGGAGMWTLRSAVRG